MSRWTLAGFGLCAVVGVFPARADDWSKQYALTGNPSLRVESDDGHVKVETWTQRAISVHVTSVGWKIAPGEVRIEEMQTGNAVNIAVRVPREHFRVDFGQRSIHIDVHMPREGELNVRTGDGHVELRTFNGPTTIRTGDGHITVTDVRGTTALSTGDGRITAHGLDGELRADTGDGQIDVEGRFDRLDLNTSDGRVQAAVRAGSKIASPWHIRTGDGNVELRLPESFGAELDAETRDGQIQVGFPITLTGALSKSRVRGPMNGGGQTLSIRTGDGSIHVGRL